MNQRNQRVRLVPPDLDTLLTRAVSRVIGQERNQSMNVDKPNQKLLPVDQSLKMKLLAEQIVRKVERKYEDRMRESKEISRVEVDRRLHEIRDEYEAERSAIQADMEKERRRMEEKMRERERTITHQMEFKIREREAKLESDRLTLENRLSEFLNAKEQFEFIQNQWKSKKDENMESLQLERERILRKESNLTHLEERARRVATAFAEAEKIENLERIRTLEMRITELKKKLADAGTQNFELRQKLDEMLGIENDLSSLKDQLRRSLNENRELAEKLRSQSDYQGLKDENFRLKQQIVDTIRQTGDNSASLARLELAQREHRAAEETSQLKIRELRLALTMMNDRLKTVTQERNYLRSEVKEMRRRDLHNLSLQKPNPSRSISNTRRKKRANSPDSTSSSVSAGFSSDGDSDIQEIRKRLHGLGQMSRDLDVCADRFLGFRSTVSAQEWDSNELDDFCREQASRREIKRQTPKSLMRHETREKRTPTIQVEEKVQNFDQSSTNPKERAQEAQREEIPRILPTQPQPEPTKSAEVPESSSKGKLSFEERLRQREIHRERALGVEPNEQIEESSKKLDDSGPKKTATTTTISEENPLFDGVDPVMARYMSLVMNQRKNVEESTVEEKPTTSSKARLDEQIVVPSFGFDRIENENDEIEW